MPQDDSLPGNFQHYLKHWRTLVGSSKVPSLSALLDHPDPHIHPWLVIVDVEADDAQKIRFAGTSVVGYFGKDLTHTNFLSILSAQAHPVILGCHHKIVETPCGAIHESFCSTEAGREFMLFGVGLPFMRSSGLPNVAWMLAPQDVRSYGNVKILVKRIVKERWIDLGNGVPGSSA